MDLISINGKYNQSVSPNDRGLLFGESVFEVIPVYHKKPFHLDLHLDRLEAGFKYFSTKPLPMADIRKWLLSYLRRMPDSPFDNIYIQVTTGQMTIRDHKPDEALKPTVIIHKTIMHNLTEKEYQKGFKATLVPDTRSYFSNIKSNHLAHNNLALQQALDKGYDSGIFVRNNCLIEGVSSNLFVVRDGILITPPTDGILDGITRQVVLNIAREHNIPYEISHILINDLATIDEIFLSSSTKILQPVIEIDDVFRKDAPGPMWARLRDLYNETVYEHCREEHYHTS